MVWLILVMNSNSTFYLSFVMFQKHVCNGNMKEFPAFVLILQQFPHKKKSCCYLTNYTRFVAYVNTLNKITNEIKQHYRCFICLDFMVLSTLKILQECISAFQRRVLHLCKWQCAFKNGALNMYNTTQKLLKCYVNTELIFTYVRYLCTGSNFLINPW